MLKLKQLFLRSLLTSKLVIALSFLAVSLAGCATQTTVTAPSISLACNTYGKPLDYSVTKDTAETVREAKVKNAAFKNIGC